MRVGGLKNQDKQTVFFEPDYLLSGTGAARSWVGDFFEELTANISGAKRIRTDSTADICPDMRYDDRTYFECKGIGRSGQGIMYQGRYKKDARFIRKNKVSLYYWFWRHNEAVLDSPTVGNLRDALARGTVSVAVIGRRALAAIIATRPLRRVNSAYMATGKRNGYGANSTYGIGWTFPLSAVYAKCRPMAIISGVAYGQPARFRLYGEDFSVLEFIK